MLNRRIHWSNNGTNEEAIKGQEVIKGLGPIVSQEHQAHQDNVLVPTEATQLKTREAS